MTSRCLVAALLTIFLFSHIPAVQSQAEWENPVRKLLRKASRSSARP